MIAYSLAGDGMLGWGSHRECDHSAASLQAFPYYFRFEKIVRVHGFGTLNRRHIGDLLKGSSVWEEQKEGQERQCLRSTRSMINGQIKRNPPLETSSAMCG